MLTVLVFLTVLLPLGYAQQAPSSSIVAAIQTAIPQPIALLDSTSPSQVPLPPKQSWCPSEIYCAGSVSNNFQVHVHTDLTDELCKSYSKQSTLRIYMMTTRCLWIKCEISSEWSTPN